MKNDELRISVTEEGVIKIDTDRISQPNHVNCEAFVREIARLAGGSTTRKAKHGKSHSHSHQHEGEHEHHGH